MLTVKDVSNIGKIVKQIRKERGLSQSEAAALCQVGTRFLSDLENGKKSTLRLKEILKVLNSFGLVLTIQRRTNNTKSQSCELDHKR